MKNIQLKFYILFFHVVVFCNLNAQTMYVRPITGNQFFYPVANIQKLTFSGGNLLITNNIGANDTFALSGNRYINFTDLTLSLAEKSSDQIIIVYPIPVNNILHINNENQSKNINKIEIFSLEGQLILEQNQFNINDPQVDVSELSKGIYLCKITIEDNSKIIKFLKQKTY